MTFVSVPSLSLESFAHANLKFSSQSEAIGSRLRPRSRSASLSGRGLHPILRPKTSSTAEINNNTSEQKIVNLVAGSSSTTKCPRGSKSATCAGKSTVRDISLHYIENPSDILPCQTRNAVRSVRSDDLKKKGKRTNPYHSFQPPLLHQINEATGKPGELRLKVRSLTGSTVYLVHVFADESVARLYELLDKAIQTSGHRGYKVVLSG